MPAVKVVPQMRVQVQLFLAEGPLLAVIQAASQLAMPLNLKIHQTSMLLTVVSQLWPSKVVSMRAVNNPCRVGGCHV